ncbi:MAG: DUF1343 domain-containing protein [Lentisphaerae bacterium]|nr:DUF1343 domain-containing protein [Lentisphaerota bacterium]
MNAVDNGIDRIRDYHALLSGRRLGVISNPSGVDRSLAASIDIIARDYRLTALFAPEHGIRGDHQAGQAVADDVDPVLQVPVYSLHGQRKRIDPAQLSAIDLLVYDIQDIGARFYTYLYTLSYAMEECARQGLPLLVLDRINPLGCTVVEGPLLRDQYQSFVGMYPMPARYALTVGEYARWINAEFAIGCELHVAPCKNYRRNMGFAACALPWVAPSPNIPTPDSALLYIGTCIFEGSNVSEGRGTTKPFEQVGAPYIDARRLQERLARHELPGVIWRATHFIPTSSKYAGELCHGVQAHISDSRTLRPFSVGMWLLHEIREQHPEFAWTAPAHADRLFGDDVLRSGREDIPAILARAERECEDFRERSRPYWLYGD